MIELSKRYIIIIHIIQYNCHKDLINIIMVDYGLKIKRIADNGNMQITYIFE